jgi:hypothetical protein
MLNPPNHDHAGPGDGCHKLDGLHVNAAADRMNSTIIQRMLAALHEM